MPAAPFIIATYPGPTLSRAKALDAHVVVEIVRAVSASNSITSVVSTIISIVIIVVVVAVVKGITYLVGQMTGCEVSQWRS